MSETIMSADELAELFLGLPAAGRAVVFRSKMPPAGLLRVLDRMDRAAAAGIAREIVAGAGADRAYVQRLTEAALDGAAGADEARAEDDHRLALFAAMAEDGPTGAYADAVARAAVQTAQADEGGAAAGDGLDGLLAALAGETMPSELGRLAARMADQAEDRLGRDGARRLAGRLVGRCVLVPALRRAGASPHVVAAMLTVADDASPRTGDAAAMAWDDFVQDLIGVGHLAIATEARDPAADPDALEAQMATTIATEVGLIEAFQVPTPADPLGTAPRLPLTALGRAIAEARLTRDTDYDWVAVQDLADSRPGDFAALLRDERLSVLEQIEV